MNSLKIKLGAYDEQSEGFHCFIPCDWFLETKWHPTEALVQICDSRSLSDKQRRFCYKLMKDIADYTGDSAESTKQFLKMDFLSDRVDDLGEKIFSLSNAPMSLVAEFENYLVRFILDNDIPCSVPLLAYTDDIQAYLYACLINKKCAVCGKKTDLHHVDRIGMGRDRTDIIHEGLEVLPLCREHHQEAHTMPDAEFFEKYYINKGVVMDKTLCKIYGLRSNKKC